MKLSKQTLTILNNLATIHDHLLITPGRVLRLRANPALYIEALVAEEFPVEAGIYNLNHFLRVVELFRSAEFDFSEKHVLIVEEDRKAEVTYAYAPSSFIDTKPPKNTPALPSHTIAFNLPEEKWTSVQKAASVLKQKDLRIVCDGEGIRVTTFNAETPNGGKFSVTVEGDPGGFRCGVVMAASNLKLLKGSYRVTITPKFTVFENTDGYELKYYVACAPGSTFQRASKSE